MHISVLGTAAVARSSEAQHCSANTQPPTFSSNTLLQRKCLSPSTPFPEQCESADHCPEHGGDIWAEGLCSHSARTKGSWGQPCWSRALRPTVLSLERSVNFITACLPHCSLRCPQLPSSGQLCGLPMAGGTEAHLYSEPIPLANQHSFAVCLESHASAWLLF